MNTTTTKLVLTIAATTICLVARAYLVTVADRKWPYYIEGETATIFRGVTPNTGDIVIPESIQHDGDIYPVTKIEGWAFSNCKSMTSILIPGTVKEIGDRAFAGCSSLKHVTIPASVTNIDWSAFASCSSMVSFNVDKANPSFKSVNGLLLTKDGKILRSEVNGKVKIPDSVEVIAGGAFSGRESLTQVYIPASLHGLRGWDFWDCPKLKSFSVADANPHFKSVNGLLLSKDGKRLVRGVNGKVIIPDTVTQIGDCAFDRRCELTAVSIPGSVTNIGLNAFRDCKSLKTVLFRGDAPEVMVFNHQGMMMAPDGRGVAMKTFSGLAPDCKVLLPKGNPTYIVEDGKWQGMTVEWYDKRQKRPRHRSGKKKKKEGGVAQ